MKQILLTLLTCILSLNLNTNLNAQDYKKEENQYSKEITESVNNITPFTFKDKDGKIYPIYISKNGRCYIYRISKKTGNEYKYYLGEEISRDICKELGIEYKEK